LKVKIQNNEPKYDYFYQNKNMKVVYLVIVASILNACMNTDSTDQTIAVAKKSNHKVLESESAEWSKNDSTVMDLMYFAWTYMNQGEDDKALVLYKHACTLPHELPDIFLYTGVLNGRKGDAIAARKYFLLEVEHDLKILRSSHFSNNRKVLFMMSLLDCYSLLSTEDRKALLLKCPEFRQYEARNLCKTYL